METTRGEQHFWSEIPTKFASYLSVSDDHITSTIAPKMMVIDYIGCWHDLVVFPLLSLFLTLFAQRKGLRWRVCMRAGRGQCGRQKVETIMVRNDVRACMVGGNVRAVSTSPLSSWWCAHPLVTILGGGRPAILAMCVHVVVEFACIYTVNGALHSQGHFNPSLSPTNFLKFFGPLHGRSPWMSDVFNYIIGSLVRLSKEVVKVSTSSCGLSVLHYSLLSIR